MRYYRECPICRASLDYGERCECERYWTGVFPGTITDGIKKEQSCNDRPFKAPSMGQNKKLYVYYTRLFAEMERLGE